MDALETVITVRTATIQEDRREPHENSAHERLGARPRSETDRAGTRGTDRGPAEPRASERRVVRGSRIPGRFGYETEGNSWSERVVGSGGAAGRITPSRSQTPGL